MTRLSQRLLLAFVAAGSVASSVPVLAQNDAGVAPPPPNYHDGYNYGYGRRPGPPAYGYPPPPAYGYPPPPGPYGRPYRRYGEVCVTARGSCPVGRPLPRTAPCGCEIPGFGYKRGAVD